MEKTYGADKTYGEGTMANGSHMNLDAAESEGGSGTRFAYLPEDGGSSRRSGHRHHHHHHHHHRSHVARRVILAVVLVLLVAVAAGGALLYRSALNVKSDASVAIEQLSTFKGQIKEGDSAGAHQTAAQMAQVASRMRQETDTPLWAAASYMPVYGSDIASVRTLVMVFDNLSTQALVPLTDSLAATSFSKIMGTEGTIDVASLQTLAQTTADAAPAITSAAATVDALPAAHLDQVAGPLEKVRTTLDELAVAADLAGKIAPALPSMLGADGQTKAYLIVAQSNAEIRSTGGFPGARGPLTVTDGHIELGDFTSDNSLLPNENILGATDEERYVCETLMAGVGVSFIPGDANGVPDFTRAAQLMMASWAAAGHGDVDGVIAVDPVFLQSMLQLTGGITLSDGTVVDGTNAAQYLLNGVYTQYATNTEQDAHFYETAKLAMAKITSSLGSVDLAAFMSALQEGIEQGRLLTYATDDTIQQAFAAMGSTGAIPTDETAPQLGVYLNNRSSSKLDWYLDLRTKVESRSANADGSTTYHMSTTMGNTVNREEAAQHDPSGYLKGSADFALVEGLLLTAPAGGSISNVNLQEGVLRAPMVEASLYGLDVWAGVVQADPGSTATVTYDVTTSPNATQDLAIHQTPTCQTFE